MKHSRHRAFWLAELLLGAAAVIVLALMFRGNEDPKRIAVVVSDSDSGAWDRFFIGIKQGAAEKNLRIVITATDAITSADEEKAILTQELASGASGLILQPAPGEDTEAMLEQMADQVPVVLVGDTPLSGTDLPVLAPDSYDCGKRLAKMMLEDYAGSLSGKRIGIVSTSLGTALGKNSIQGFLDGIGAGKEAGPEIAWTLQVSPGTSDVKQQIEEKERVDLVAALDTAAADAAGEASQEAALWGAVAYGISSSRYSVYCLDHDNIAGLVIPNDYDSGFSSIVQLSEKLRNRQSTIQGSTAEIRTFRREDLFQSENEDFLFMD